MKTTRLHTFEEVLTKGIYVEGEQEPVKVTCIFIPKIQRAYAQGRACEKDIRTDFLKELFATLTSESRVPLELSFLFGSKQPLINGHGSGFELLDGQQRATTLFLLYWYIYNRESNSLPDFLRCFTYETRDTSTQFLVKITSCKYNLLEEKPSEVLKSKKWFTDDFNCDATICAMLNMLDDIHQAYNKTGRTDLLANLNRLQFYVLLLEKFDMNDELYIKMNSRGLSLTPFENFKASLVKYMKSSSRGGIYGSDDTIEGNAPYWLDFASNIDAKWIDIFWKNPYVSGGDKVIDDIIEINDKAIGNSYFRFFNRYFFTKAALLKGVESKKLASLPAFFYNDAESAEMERRLTGWDRYEEIFNLLAREQNKDQFPVFGRIEQILNVFHSYYNSICEKISADPYERTTGFDVRNKENYLLFHRVAFAAITEFIEALPVGTDFGDSVIQDNFRKMLRVVQNIIENTLIESTIALVGVIRAVSEIINLPGATDNDFYFSLANASLKSNNQQLLEEQIKAKEMYDSSGNYDPSWESAFIEAEKHKFFKGSIYFFFSPGIGTSADFRNRFHILQNLFVENGIETSYRKPKQHVLIRAILSCLNHWDASGLSDRYFTENAEKEKYLKNILTGCPEVRIMFCKYFDNPVGTIESYLTSVIQNASCQPTEQNESFKLLFKRLINDDHSSAIYDWIEEREKEQKSCFRLQENRSYIVAIPGTWYDRMVLDTERHLIIPSLIGKGYSYSDKNQDASMNGPMKDSWGWSIDVEKSITVGSDKYLLKVKFNEWKWADFYVYGNDMQKLITVFKVDSNNIVDGGVKVAWLQYQFDKDKQPIIDKAAEIEGIIGAL